MKQLLLYIAFMFCILPAKAQFADSVKVQFIKDWQRAKAYTNEYLNAMPADKYTFRAQDSIRTFAQQMLHLSMATVSLISAATGKKVPGVINRQDLEKTSSACSKDSVNYFVNLSYDFAIEAVKDFDMSNALEHVQRGNFDETRLAWMMKAFEHQTHHRGQTTIYLRLAGIKPPNEKLF